jgi:hypothetical protein
MTFYNTINEPPHLLRESIANAKKQEEMVLALFKAHPLLDFTPPEVMHIMSGMGKNCPLTSWRRAITNLEAGGDLEKRGQRAGIYGKMNNAWKLKKLQANKQGDLFKQSIH